MSKYLLLSSLFVLKKAQNHPRFLHYISSFVSGIYIFYQTIVFPLICVYISCHLYILYPMKFDTSFKVRKNNINTSPLMLHSASTSKRFSRITCQSLGRLCSSLVRRSRKTSCYQRREESWRTYPKLCRGFWGRFFRTA